MIRYRKTKTYVLVSNPTKSGLAVTEMYVKREFLISIDTLVLIDHKSSSTNHYHWNTLTKIWAIFLVELHDKIHGYFIWQSEKTLLGRRSRFEGREDWASNSFLRISIASSTRCISYSRALFLFYN